MSKKKILVIEDEPDIAAFLRIMGEFEGHEITYYYGSIEDLPEGDFDVAICDYWLGTLGVADPFINELNHRGIPVFLYTALQKSGIPRSTLNKVVYVSKLTSVSGNNSLFEIIEEM